MNDSDKIGPDTRYVKVTGINDHKLPNKPIIQCCSVSVDSKEQDVLCIYNEYAKCNEMAGSIHSKVQLAAYGIDVDDKPKKAGGKQRIVCRNHGGTERIFSLFVDSGLCYLPQRYPTDEEMRTLPQQIMTSDQIWDPTMVFTLIKKLIAFTSPCLVTSSLPKNLR